MADIDAILTPYTPDERLLPNSIRDERSLMLLHLMWGLVRFDVARLNTYNIDTVQADVLPHLIDQFKLKEFANNRMPESVQRQLIKSALLIHRLKGTRQGIKTIAQLALGITVGFTEWWEFNGTPHTFKLTLNTQDTEGSYLGGFDAAAQADLLRIVNYAKPARSHLTGFTVTASLSATVRAGVATRSAGIFRAEVREQPQVIVSTGAAVVQRTAGIMRVVIG